MFVNLPDRSLPSVRGVIPLHNCGGLSFRLTDVHRWLTLLAHGYAVKKVDLHSDRPDVPTLENLLAYAREFQVAVSLRTSAEAGPPDVQALAAAGLADVLLAPSDIGACELDAWMAACRGAGLPIRLQLPCTTLAPDWIGRAVEQGVRVITLADADPFCGHRPGDFDEATLAALAAAEVELNLLTAEADRVPERWRRYVVDPAWQHLEPAFYHREALAWAVARFGDSPRRVRALSLLALTRLAQLDNPADGAIMLWLTKYWPRLIGPLVGLTKGRRLARWKAPEEVGPPRLALSPGEVRRHYLDAVDGARYSAVQQRGELADRARTWQQARTPDRVFESHEWSVENAFFERLLGVNKIRTVSSRPIHGTKLPWVEAPYLVTATFGGGLAEGIGFGAGRHLRMCCPMVGTTHQVSLFVDEAGQYVLLRDGQPVSPLDFGGRFCVPWRLPDAMHLHIQAFNVDESLAVTSVRVWDGEQSLPSPDDVRWSVVVFSTKFARRLQAVLLALAHQRDMDLSALEVIVGYVPGVDGTEDTLDSIRLAHPDLRIVHASFPEHNLKSKGFVLNEAMALASGSWIVILDSDIILPPDFFATLAREAGGGSFLAPAGRAMLDAAQTARVLTGEVKSWEAWDSLREGASAFREAENEDGVPVGYCQVFRRDCLEQVRYPEYEHFQGADYEFGAAMNKHFGPVCRIGLPVLHLHHGGRQWYGTQKHY